jgi:glycosyltransferase involved in cell wall biosynthesis
MIQYTIIVATYNRLEELKELVESFQKMENVPFEFELLLVDDGSTDGTLDYFTGNSFDFPIRIVSQDHQGPGAARNLGMKEAKGSFFIFMDSDCTVPPNYLQEVHIGIKKNLLDAFGGPDTFRVDFPPLLKAINYSMTSFLGTGGTRGSTKSVTKYYPRSFNMGLSRKVYESIGEMSGLRHGQDMDYSARIYKAGFNVGLISDAFVYHKRRTSLKKFFKQVFNWGVARINLGTIHPELLKPVHFIPAFLILAGLGVLVGALFLESFLLLLSIGFIALVIVLSFVTLQSALSYKSLNVGFLSIFTLLTQIIAYGLGVISGVIQKITGKKTASGFVKNYYK